jgi:hypothetical protein
VPDSTTTSQTADQKPTASAPQVALPTARTGEEHLFVSQASAAAPVYAPQPSLSSPAAASWLYRAFHPYMAEWLTGACLALIWLLAVLAFITQWDAISSTGDYKDMSLDGVNEHHLLALIAAAGALGAMIHALTSFASYVGNGTFDARWALWYISRPAVGATLALCILPLLRAGFIDNSGAFSKSENATFTLVSLAILVGMFSKDATDKLADIFSTFLSSSRNQSRDGKLNSQPPVLESLTPATLAVGSSQLRILVSGQNFAESTRMMVNGTARKTSYNGPDQLVFWLNQTDVTAPGTLAISARSQDPTSSQESAPLSLTISSTAG